MPRKPRLHVPEGLYHVHMAIQCGAVPLLRFMGFISLLCGLWPHILQTVLQMYVL